MFDYVLTGPISGVSAGQYIMGLAIEVDNQYFAADFTFCPDHIKLIQRLGLGHPRLS